MPEQQIYSRSAQIIQSFNSASGNEVKVLYEPGLVTPWDVVPTTRYYGFVTDLRLKVDIDSIEEQELPELSVLSSKTERITAVRDMEWKAPRKELALYLEASGRQMVQIASLALLNRLPYYHVNLMPYFTDNGIYNVANDARILAQVIDVGYGLLAGNDNLVVFGSVKEEVTTLPTDAKKVSSANPYGFTVTTSSAQLLPANPNRLQLTLVNTGSTGKIFINYGNTAQLNKGICLLPNGGSYEINESNPYLGLISAISDNTAATLSALECV